MPRRSKTPPIRPEKTPEGYAIGPKDTSFGQRVILVNPSDRDWTKHRFVLQIGEVSPTNLMIWANGLESAMEEAGSWIEDHAPGLFCDDQVVEEYKEAYAEAITEGKDEEEANDHALEAAEADTYQFDRCHYLNSDHWNIGLEDPTRSELDAYLYPPGIDWSREREKCDSGSPWSKCQPASRGPYGERLWF